MNALSITALRKQYKSGIEAVRGINLAVPEKSFFGFLGPNGAGKTTTISCITGISLPTSGTIEIFGHNAVAEYRSARMKVGLSPQEFNFDFFGPIEKTLYYVGGYYGIPSEARRTRIRELLEHFDLIKYRNTPFRELSGGYKRRVMLVRSLIHDPDLLILDEPTAGVDVETRHVLWKYLEELNSAGKTIILTSHYIEEVEKLCDQIAVINQGIIVAEGPIGSFTEGGKKLEDTYLSLVKSPE